jgi:hypothetical protein
MMRSTGSSPSSTGADFPPTSSRTRCTASPPNSHQPSDRASQAAWPDTLTAPNQLNSCHIGATAALGRMHRTLRVCARRVSDWDLTARTADLDKYICDAWVTRHSAGQALIDCVRGVIDTVTPCPDPDEPEIILGE